MERVSAIAKQLIEADEYLSVGMISKRLKVSSKTIRNDLEDLEVDLKPYNLDIMRRSGKGVQIQGNEKDKQKYLRKINRQHSDEVAELLPRQVDLALRVIGKTRPVYIKTIAVDLFVSRATVNRDIMVLNKEFFSEFGLVMENGNDGLIIVGEEMDKRSAMTRLISKKCEAKLQSLAVEDNEFIIYLQKLLGIDVTSLIRFLNQVEHDFKSEMTIEAQRNFLIHVAVAIKRIQRKAIVPVSPYLDQQIEIHSDEMNILKDDIQEIEQIYSVIFDNQELYLLLLHLISSDNLENDDTVSSDFDERVNLLIQQISKDIGKDFSQDEELKKSLVLHLRIALKRVEFGMRIDNPFLIHVIERSFDLFVAVKNNIKTVFEDSAVPDAEIAYITIHFMASLERIQKKPRVMVLCASGLGVSQLLMERIKRYFPNYDVKGVIRLDDLSTLTTEDVDLIISTVEIGNRTDIAHVLIDPMGDLKGVQENTHRDVLGPEKLDSPFSFRHDGVLTLQNFSTKEDVLSQVSDWLIQRQCATPEYKKALLEREAIGSTYVGNGIALIHGRYSNEDGTPSLNVIRLSTKILWDRKSEVDLLLNFIPTESTRQDFAKLFQRIGRTIDDECFWEQIKQVEPGEMVGLLNKEFGL